MPQASFVIPSAAYYVVSVTIAAPVSFTGNDLAQTLKWRGGEADDTPGTQGFPSDGNAGVMAGIGYAVFGQDYGFALPPSHLLVLNGNDVSTPLLDYLEEEAVINPYSSWGGRGVMFVDGSNIHTINSNLSNTPGWFGYAFDCGSSQAGNYVVMLMNVASHPFPLSYTVLGQTLELDIFDPALGLGSDLGYVLTVSPTGTVTGPRVGPPVLPQLSGRYVGAEGVLVSSTLTQVLESTMAAHWRAQ